MADKVTDTSNREQVAVCLRWVDQHFEPHEEFVGLHVIDTVASDRITTVLKDQGFIQWGVGGSFPLKTLSFSPKKKERKKRKRRERERERERKREVHGVGRGVCIFLRRIASDQYSLLLHDSII